MMRSGTQRSSGPAAGDAITAGRLIFFGWLVFLLTILILGWVVRPADPPLPAGIERSNPNVYGGWVPTAHPLGVVGNDNADLLEKILMSLSRTLTGPLLACAVAVFLGGLWGTWAAFREGLAAKALEVNALLLEALPRIVLFALFLRVVRDMSGGRGLNLNILHLTIAFAVFQIPAIALSFRNRVRSVVREGYVEGLISLGFPRRTIVLRDLYLRECGPLARLQYVARVTELIALETAVSYAISGSQETTVGSVVRKCWDSGQSGCVLILAGCLAVYLISFSAFAQTETVGRSARARKRVSSMAASKAGIA